jgi:hypothetical protein
MGNPARGMEHAFGPKLSQAATSKRIHPNLAVSSPEPACFARIYNAVDEQFAMTMPRGGVFACLLRGFMR